MSTTALQKPLPSMVKIDGESLRRHRVEAGLKPRDLAAAVGISRPYLNQLENGRRLSVSPPVFNALLGALKLTERSALEAS